MQDMILIYFYKGEVSDQYNHLCSLYLKVPHKHLSNFAPMMSNVQLRRGCNETQSSQILASGLLNWLWMLWTGPV